MIPVTLDKDAEQQGAVSGSPTFRRRLLFIAACIAAGLAADGLLTLALAVLGYTHKTDASPTSIPSVQRGPIQGQDGVVDSSSSPVSTVLPTDPLQVVPYLFREYTVPAVAAIVTLVLLVVLAVVLPIALSQSVEEVPVDVDPEPAPAPEPTPVPEPAPEPGFFDRPLNLGLTIGGSLLAAIVIGAVSFGIHRRTSNRLALRIKTEGLADQITMAYGKFKSAERSEESRTIDLNFRGDFSKSISIPGVGDMSYEIHSPACTLKQYNEKFVLKRPVAETHPPIQIPAVLRARNSLGSNLRPNDLVTEDCSWDPVVLTRKSLGSKSLECLNELLEFVKSLNSTTAEDFIKIENESDMDSDEITVTIFDDQPLDQKNS